MASSSAGTADGVLGLVSGMGICLVSVVLGCAGPSTSAFGALWSVFAFSRMAQALKVVKGFIAHLNSWTYLPKWCVSPGHGGLALSAQYCKAGHRPGSSRLLLTVILARQPGVQSWQEQLPLYTLWGRACGVVICDLEGLTPYPGDFKRSMDLLGKLPIVLHLGDGN